MKFLSSPIIICGAHGGGTSYITKMLRHAGLFAGWDAGPIGARKFHESSSFKSLNYALGDCAGDRDIMTAESIDWVSQELSMNREAWVDRARRSMPDVQASFGIPEKSFAAPAPALARVLRRARPSSRWAWPGYVSWRLRIVEARQPWGWKDPRNSVTMPLWQTLFPDARVLTIEKRPSGNRAKSSSGAWFRNPSNRIAVDRYQQPDVLPGTDLIKVSFEAATSQSGNFNQLLEWLGLPTLSRRQFDGLLTVTGFEG